MADENLTERVYLPRPPTAPSGRSFTDLVTALKSIFTFIPNLVRSLEDNANNVHRTVNEMTNRGEDLVAASTLELTARIHSVSGAGTITTLTASPGFRGWAYLVSIGGGWSLGVGGNIAATAAPADGSMLPVLFDPETALWYPASSPGGDPHLAYVFRGTSVLEGTKDGANVVFTLPGGDEFWLDANGEVVGTLWQTSNFVTEVTGVPGYFEYRRDSLTQITLGLAPAAGDRLAFSGLAVLA